MKKHLILLTPLIIAILLTSGCYTILSHPGEENGYMEYGETRYCFESHPNYHESFGYSHYYYPDYWDLYPRWGRYYAVPWWWDYYPLDDGYYYDGSVGQYSPRSSRGEKAVRPKSRWQDLGTGVPRITRGSSGTTSSSSSSESGNLGNKPAKEESETETKAKESKKKEKEQKRKPTRRGGRWRSK